MKNLITDRHIKDLVKSGKRTLTISNNSIISPLARDTAKQYGVTFAEQELVPVQVAPSGSFSNRRVVIGNDHNAVEIKNKISEFLISSGFDVIDAGVNDSLPADYPDIAEKAVNLFFGSNAAFCILIDAVGNASAMTANKFKGIRAAVCFNEFSARSAREHNDANLLAIGGKALGEETILSIVKAWLATSYSGGRHQKRLDKLFLIENRKCK
ncbi:MAG: RpiB/LacA/LacB family sugar-phosphate isomerase [Ignavibacteriaceae bacterium]|nr:RpiB/LacA/LacB family sugar-phosphate isomerase [Ignavibacteriaceae bacterium]